MAKPKVKQKIRLLLVDDHEVVRTGLHGLLARDPEIQVVGEAATADEAISQAVRLTPDVVLLDIRLPEGGGIGACRQILEVCPETRILFLTSFAEDETVLAAILSGGHGYLLKEIGAEELLRSIKRVAAGQTILDPMVTRRVVEWMKGLAPQPAGAEAEGLSPQEQRIVALVAEGKTNKEIANMLDLSDKTVKNYLANVFQKLQITRRTQVAAFFAKRHT